MGQSDLDTVENLIKSYQPALKAYARNLDFARAARAQGMTRRALVAARGDDIDLDSAFREIEDRTLDRIERGVMKRAIDDPAEARFVLRSKRPDEWGGNDKGPSGPVQVNFQVNLFPPDVDE